MKGSKQNLLWQHIRKAQETVKGESQLAEYVARLEIAECAGVLAASPEGACLSWLPTGMSAG